MGTGWGVEGGVLCAVCPSSFDVFLFRLDFSALARKGVLLPPLGPFALARKGVLRAPTLGSGCVAECGVCPSSFGVFLPPLGPFALSAMVTSIMEFVANSRLLTSFSVYS